ncbi:MAG: copper amine oxidase N-terminal domain-containing protein [Caldiserica bacterium]|jgi:hypothetical protein|nr:copper amine oxidase N-terminal domain-containing protein [Caldisericota bacterium]
MATSLVSATVAKSINFKVGSLEVTEESGFGTKTWKIDAAPVVINGRVMVPVRFLVQSIGIGLTVQPFYNPDGTVQSVSVCWPETWPVTP